MFTQLIQAIKDKIATRKAIMVFPRKIEKYKSQVVLYLASFSFFTVCLASKICP